MSQDSSSEQQPMIMTDRGHTTRRPGSPNSEVPAQLNPDGRRPGAANQPIVPPEQYVYLPGSTTRNENRVFYQAERGSHVGDHSVSTPDCLSEVLALSEIQLAQYTNDLIEQCLSNVDETSTDVIWSTDNNTWRITSTVEKPTVFGCRPVTIVADVMSRVHIASEENIHRTNVEFCCPNVTSVLPCNSLAAYEVDGRNGVRSGEAIENILLPYLATNDESCASYLSGCLYDNLDIVDNIGLYAKLWYNMLQAAQLETAPYKVPDEIPPYADPYEVVDLRVAEALRNAEYQHLCEAIANRDFVFLEGFNFKKGDEGKLAQLATSNNPYEAAVGNQTPAGTAYRFPAIRVVLVYNRSDPVPAADVPRQRYSAESLRHWILNLASRRGELIDCARGLHWAKQLAGSHWVNYNYPVIEGVVGATGSTPVPERAARCIYVPCTPYFEASGVIQIPRPLERNFFAMLVSQIPPQVPSKTQQAMLSKFCHSPIEVIAKSTALISAMISTATSTTCMSLSIRRKYLQQATAKKFTERIWHCLCETGFIRRTSPAMKHSPTIFGITNQALTNIFGATMHPDICVGRSWCSDSFRIAAGYTQATSGLLCIANMDNRPYYTHNPLSLIKWTKSFPLEWGVTGPCPTYNFSHEVIINSVQSGGWRAVMGSSAYHDQASNRTAGLAMIAYGHIALNVICQQFSIVDQPQLQYQTLQRTLRPDHQCVLSSPQNLPADDSMDYISDLNIFHPFCFVTYDYDTDRVRALCLHGEPIAKYLVRLLDPNTSTARESGFILRTSVFESYLKSPPSGQYLQNLRLK